MFVLSPLGAWKPRSGADLWLVALAAPSKDSRRCELWRRQDEHQGVGSMFFGTWALRSVGVGPESSGQGAGVGTNP